jgi:DNA-binding NarL/FixJ family response regulator
VPCCWPRISPKPHCPPYGERWPVGASWTRPTRPPAPGLIAAACRAVDDDDGAEMELAGAIPVFDQLNASRDAAAAKAARHAASRPSSGLTSREEEVLAHIAKGLTNRQIAERLVVSEKTVATHVGHILTKLGLPSRAAATAYAYEHGLH